MIFLQVVAFYLILEGTFVTLWPVAACAIAKYIFVDNRKQNTQRFLGAIAAVVGGLLFTFAPAEGKLVWLMYILGFPAVAYGLSLALLSPTVFKSILAKLQSFSSGQLRMMGLGELVVGLVLLGLLLFLQ